MLILYKFHNVAFIKLSFHFTNWLARGLSIHQKPKEQSVVGMYSSTSYTLLWERKLAQSLWKTIQHYLINLKTHIHCDSNLPFLGIFPWESSPCAPGHMSKMFTAVLFLTAKKLETTQTAIDEGIDNCVLKEISTQSCTCANGLDCCLTLSLLEASRAHPKPCRGLDQV